MLAAAVEGPGGGDQLAAAVGPPPSHSVWSGGASGSGGAHGACPSGRPAHGVWAGGRPAHDIWSVYAGGGSDGSRGAAPISHSLVGPGEGAPVDDCSELGGTTARLKGLGAD